MILRRDEAELHLTLDRAHKGAARNVAHLVVSDARLAHDRCEARGARIIKAIKDHDFGMRVFVLADPDANRVDVSQPL